MTTALETNSQQNITVSVSRASWQIVFLSTWDRRDGPHDRQHVNVRETDIDSLVGRRSLTLSVSLAICLQVCPRLESPA